MLIETFDINNTNAFFKVLIILCKSGNTGHNLKVKIIIILIATIPVTI